MRGQRVALNARIENLKLGIYSNLLISGCVQRAIQAVQTATIGTFSRQAGRYGAKLGRRPEFEISVTFKVMQILNTHPPSTGLLRLGAAARLAGLTPDAMRAALNRQQIPIGSIQIGKLQFVRATELQSWLSSAPAPASANLFK